MTEILVVPDRSFNGGLDHGAAELIGAASELGTPVVLTDATARTQLLSAAVMFAVLALAGVIGVLAALLPARRASRMDVLQAISTE